MYRTESSDLLAVLDQLNTNALSDSGVGLLGLDTDLLEDDALGVGGTTEGGGLESGTEGTLLVSEIGPLLVLTVHAQLARRIESTRHVGWMRLLSVEKVPRGVVVCWWQSRFRRRDC